MNTSIGILYIAVHPAVVMPSYRTVLLLLLFIRVGCKIHQQQFTVFKKNKRPIDVFGASVSPFFICFQLLPNKRPRRHEHKNNWLISIHTKKCEKRQKKEAMSAPGFEPGSREPQSLILTTRRCGRQSCIPWQQNSYMAIKVQQILRKFLRR